VTIVWFLQFVSDLGGGGVSFWKLLSYSKNSKYTLYTKKYCAVPKWILTIQLKIAHIFWPFSNLQGMKDCCQYSASRYPLKTVGQFYIFVFQFTIYRLHNFWWFEVTASRKCWVEKKIKREEQFSKLCNAIVLLRNSLTPPIGRRRPKNTHRDWNITVALHCL